MTLEWGLPKLRTARSGRRKGLGILLDSALLFCVVVFGIGLRFGVCESMMVVSGSMEPAMPIGACFLVDHRASLHGHWQRGDVVLFSTPPRTMWPEGGNYVKRIIGLPGETIQIRGGKVFVNDLLLSEPYLKEVPDPETMPPRILAPGHYFMMGDNRNDSEDSRYEGAVDEASIRGKIVAQYWPLSEVGVVRRAG